MTNILQLKIGVGLILLVATFFIYSQVQDHNFINFDDDLYITDNLNVQAGLNSESFIWSFTTSHPPYWHPVTWLSHMLDYHFYGSNPKGHYLTNLFLHICSVLIVGIVFFRMTGGFWQSSFIAAMFAVHPLNVESIAWLAERKNVLSTLFWILTMWAYVSYAEKPTIKRYGLVFLFFTLGLMSKPMLVTLPFALLLLDYWPLKRLSLKKEKNNNTTLVKITSNKSNFFKLIAEKIPLFFLSIGLSILTVYFQTINGAVKSLDLIPLQARLTNSLVSYLEYLGKIAWPSKLSILYPHPENALPVWLGIFCGVVLVSITIISIKLINKAPYLTVGWFWYLGTLLPVIGIVQVGGQAMADRFTYIPQIGIFMIIAWGIPDLVSKWRHKEKVLAVSVGIITLTLMITTWIQVGHWKNSITIFQHAIKVTGKKYPNLAVAHNHLGMALFAEQRNEEAIMNYKSAIKLNPEHTYAHYNLGIALFAEQRNEEAISHYKRAISLSPNYTFAHYNLGNSLFAVKKYKEAIFHYKMAIKLNPNYTFAHYNLGNALFAIKKNKEAIFHYKMAIKLNPSYTYAHYNLGIVLLHQKEPKEAAQQFKETIRLRPDLEKAHDYFKMALLQSEKIE